MKNKMKYLTKNLTTCVEREFGSFKRACSHLKFLNKIGFKASVYMQFSNYYGQLEKIKVQV